MAAKARPWMRWHVTRWRNSPSVMKMSLAAQGAYRNLLEAAWQQGGRLPNDCELFWRYALAQSPEEFAAVAEQVLRMFDVSECGNWLTNETLTEECAATVDQAAELSRKRSEAGKKGNEIRWGNADGKASSQNGSQPASQKESQIGSQNVAIAESPAINHLLVEEHGGATSQTIAKNRINNNKTEHRSAIPDRSSEDRSIDVAQWKCIELGLASPRWARPPEALCAFDGALQAEQRQNPSRPLTAIADELGELWLEYTRSSKGSGQFAMGPAKFFGEGWYRRASSWRDARPANETTVDGSDFIAEKQRKREAAMQEEEDLRLREAALQAEREAASNANC